MANTKTHLDQPKRTSDLWSLQAFLVGLVERARVVDMARYEGADSARLLGELVPQTTILVMEAVDILACLLDRYDPDEGERESLQAEEAEANFFHRVDLVMVNRQSAERIADLSFLARGELRLMLEFLAGLSAGVDTWQIIAACGRCLGKLAKAMTAVDAALCAHEGCEAVLLYDSELAHSLEVRRAYGNLCRDLRDCESDSVVASLQGAATSIAKLIGRDVYAHLRISDRVQVRSLQEQIIAWQRAPEQDLPAGLRLWQDVWGFAHLLLDVNKRQELVEHDRQALEEIHLRLARDGEISSDVRRFLDALFGLDEELDLLLGDSPLEIDSLEAPLRRLRSRHEPTAAPKEPSDWAPDDNPSQDLTLRQPVAEIHPRTSPLP